jgi:hypothetical protein
LVAELRNGADELRGQEQEYWGDLAGALETAADIIEQQDEAIADLKSIVRNLGGQRE